MINKRVMKRSIPLYLLGSWPVVLLAVMTGAMFASLILGQVAHSAPPAASHGEASSDATVVDQNQAEAFSAAIKQMAMNLFANLGDPDPGAGDLADGIAVSSFVELKKLTRTSSFGRYLAEQLMSEFQQQGYRVVEIRKSTSIMMQEKRGEYGLSRDTAEVSPSVAARTLITGTYTLAVDHILVNAKVLDNKNAALLSSATMVFPRTRLTDLLLADSASAVPPKQEMISLKKLEM